MKLVRETAHQSSNDLDYISQLDGYWNDSPGTAVEKLETFTKFVSRQSLTKFIARLEIFKMQQEVHGSVVEVGVHRGASLMTWAHLSSILEPVNYLRNIIGFDTFEGFPDIGDKDSKGVSEHLVKGGFAVGDTPDIDLERAIGLYDTNRMMNHIPKCELVKGDVAQTLPNYLEENPHLLVSLLHLDADLHAPTKTALDLLLPRMPKGAIILFDELNMKLFPGETIALLETLNLNKYPLRRFSYATSMSYLVIE
ncbi:MAG: class I SAM-dependent methyltransferase [Rhodospirillales bacterium]|nr:class I SAM-dependent methyltransferase [Rhodospirillales bacterium]